MKNQLLRSIIIAGAAIFTAGAAKAQVTVKAGPEFGLGATYLTNSLTGAPTDDYSGLSAHIGGTLELQLGRWFELRPSVFLQTRSFIAEDGYQDNNSNKITNNNLFIPVDAMFTFRSRRGSKFFIGLGPYFAYTFSGRYRYYDPNTNSEVTDNLRLGTGSSYYDMDPLDIGIDFKLGFQMSNNFFMNFSADYGISNRAPSNTANYSIQDFQTFNIGIGYLFGRQERSAHKSQKKVYHRHYDY